MNDLVFDRPDLTPPLAKGGRWRLVHDWTVVFRGECYHIPAGFETDGASIPRPLWWICGTPLEVPRLYAAIVHDFIYGGGDPDATRADADDLFRDVQIALGISRLKAHVEWAALRLFGWTHWTGRHVCDGCALLDRSGPLPFCSVTRKPRHELVGVDVCQNKTTKKGTAK